MNLGRLPAALNQCIPFGASLQVRRGFVANCQCHLAGCEQSGLGCLQFDLNPSAVITGGECIWIGSVKHTESIMALSHSAGLGSFTRLLAFLNTR